MKRSRALATLSRDHHVALVVARALARASSRDVDAAAARYIEFLAGHELTHFAVEESVLLPAVPACARGQALASQVRADHRELREALARLQGGEPPATVPVLHELGARLRAHVLLEERELFPYLERTLDDAALADLGARLAHDLGED
jgi:hemerythrin-like domain-containing protein